MAAIDLQAVKESLTTDKDYLPVADGGPGSGNHGHQGRPGKVGGSGGGGGGGAKSRYSFTSRTSFPAASRPIQRAKIVGELHTKPIDLTEEQRDVVDAELDKMVGETSDYFEKKNKEIRHWGAYDESGYRKAKIAEIPPTMSDAVRDVYMDAVAAEKDCTSSILDINNSLDGVSMDGLEFRLKGAESYDRKVKTIMQDMALMGKVADERDVANSLFDLNRYTQVSENENLATNVNKTLDMLEKKGYVVTKVKNYWLKPDSAYRGINTSLISPNGKQVELQFHTPETIKARDVNHTIYELQRQYREGDSMYNYSDNLMKQNIYDVGVPNNIWEVKQRG